MIARLTTTPTCICFSQCIIFIFANAFVRLLATSFKGNAISYMSVECYKTYSYLNKLLHSIIMPVHWFSILDGSNLKWRATYHHRRFRQQIRHPVHSDIRQPFIGLYPFLIMKKPNKTASDLTACSIPTHAVMMHITKTSLENWKRKVIPEIFSTDNFKFISYIQLMSIHYQLMLILMVPSFLNFILHLRHIWRHGK